ncbi:Fic family protein [Actinotignum sanguinis]|uniref:Fic family protein n=1 Tax=Actinotignum sanguinis TaxID=1445614 RepID=UPI0013E06587|nr:Fic family protein [Actinotignum sanguinis]MDY5148377.1 Fic family protein [Actinotignum sanguinis]
MMSRYSLGSRQYRGYDDAASRRPASLSDAVTPFLLPAPAAPAIAPRTPEKAIERFAYLTSGHVWSMATLEGKTITLPEVVTLIEERPLPGHKRSDEDVAAMVSAHELVANLVREGSFRMDEDSQNRIHRTLTYHSLIDSGVFRGEGSVRGEHGNVDVAGTHYQAPRDPATLRTIFTASLAHLDDSDPLRSAVQFFATSTLAQYYFDGNKRTARLMASGYLMARGYDAIAIPAAYFEEYQNALRELFLNRDIAPIAELIYRGAEELG